MKEQEKTFTAADICEALGQRPENAQRLESVVTERGKTEGLKAWFHFALEDIAVMKNGVQALCWIRDTTFGTPLVGTLVADPSAPLAVRELYAGQRTRDAFHFNCLEGQTKWYRDKPTKDHHIDASEIEHVVPIAGREKI